MKNKIGIIKRALCISLVFLLNINSFAAIVSDNDGSAFITKAEFDSLKNNFQSQIDSYNQSIDSKIDGAIASYLAGIKINTENEIIWNPVYFMNVVPTCTFVDPAVGIQASITNDVCLKRCNNLVFGIRANNYLTGKSWFLGPYVSNSTMTSVFFNTNNVYVYGFKNGNYSTYSGDLNIYLKDVTGWTSWTSATNMQDTSKAVSKHTSELVNKQSLSNRTSAATTAKCFLAEKVGGECFLKNYASDYGATALVEVWDHVYLDRFPDISSDECFNNMKKWYLGDDNGKADTRTGTTNITLPDFDRFGKLADVGTKETGLSTTDAVYASTRIMSEKTIDGLDYREIQFSNGTNIDVAYAEIDGDLQVGSDNEWTVSGLKFTDTYFRYDKGEVTQTNDIRSEKISFKSALVPLETKKLNELKIYSLQRVVDEPVKYGQGVPIIKTVNDDNNVHIKIKFKCVDSSGVTVTDTINYEIANDKFVDGVAQTGTSLANGSISSADTLDVNFNVSGRKAIWINLASATANNRVTIDTIDLI